MVNCFIFSNPQAVIIFAVLLLQGHDLVIGNVGDSRAVMGTRDMDNNLVAVQLTVDLKPNLPSMYKRHIVIHIYSALF